MDLTFGKGSKIFGGILIRSLISMGATGGKHLAPNDFIEGPCNSVTKILAHNSDAQELKEVKDFVVLKDFSTDAFLKADSRLRLSHIDEKENEICKPFMSSKKLWTCPRVGLTLKRFDEHKPKFWMKDYRFIIFPDKNKKMNAFTVLSMIKEGLSEKEIALLTKVKPNTIQELRVSYLKGTNEEKKRISDYKDSSGEFKNENFAFVYGLHQKAMF